MKKLLIVIALLLTASCGGGNSDAPDKADVYQSYVSWKHEARTAKAVRVTSADEINNLLLPEIDKGFDTVFDISRRVYGYTPRENAPALVHSGYTVTLFRRSPKCINPGFLVPADGSAWDGTEYDKDPRAGKVLLCAAGLNHSWHDRWLVVVNDFSIMQEIVRFEAEHAILYWCDEDKFWATAGVHAHPLIPDTDGSFASKGEAKYKEAKLGKTFALVTK